MDQAQAHSTGTGGGGSEPKLKIDKVTDGNITALKFTGIIDEQFHGKTVAQTVKGGTLILDLADIQRISSFGIREWVDFVSEVGQKCASILFIELAPKVVDQFNMVQNFGGAGKILSFYAPYRCDYCDDDRKKLLQFDRDYEAIQALKPPEEACASCGNPEYFDEDAASFFSFLSAQQRFDIDPQVATFLASKMNYSLAEGARKIRADKTVEGRMTYVHLAGDLDGSFPRDKLAEGLEGDVIFDLSGIGKIDPAGAAEWRQMMRDIAAPTDRIFLVGCPPVFVERLTREEDLGGKAQVLTFAMPYTCARCATTASQAVDVEQHFDVLKFATPPEMKCADCGGDTVCAASDVLLAHLAALPRPVSDTVIKKFITEVHERQTRPVAGALPGASAAAVATATMAQARAQNTMSVLLGAAIVIVLVLGAAFLWKLRSGASLREDEGQLIEASEGKPPPWINQEFYRDNDNIYFTGNSAFMPSKDDAIYEASAAAVERAVNQLGVMVRNGKWIDILLNQFQSQRARALSELEKATVQGDLSKIAAARKTVAEARLRVAKLLKLTAGNLAPAENSGFYWEKFQTGGGLRYRAFARYTIPKPNFEKLVERYTQEHEALGIRAVTLFPGLAWSYPELEDVKGGAVIMSVSDKSPFAMVGFSEGDLVLEINDRSLRDSDKFADAFQQEYDSGCSKGGKLHFRIKHGARSIEDYNLNLPRGCGNAVGAAERHAAARRQASGSGRPASSKSGKPRNIWDEILNDNPEE
ncbi:MAG TPA: PDZ domain-containing protein [Polyangia bacterium]|nr:PDZ domain-containing protein [Polyangia bacterium]